MIYRGITLVILFVIIASISVVYAQQQHNYILRVTRVESTSTTIMHGGGYNLNATAGQPIVGTSSGEGYILEVPIFSSIPQPNQTQQKTYLPFITR